MSQAQLLTSQINDLRNSVSRAKGRENVIQDYDFSISPTCPPSTAVVVRQGKVWINSAWWFFLGYIVEKPSDTVDFGDHNNIGYYQWPNPPQGPALDLSFENAGHYKAIALMFSATQDGWVFGERVSEDESFYEGNGDWKYYVLGGQQEHATAQGAEAEIDVMLNGGLGDNAGVDPSNDNDSRGIYSWIYFPLWTIIFRNNGTTESPNAILPIDLLNRGRSYLYRDLRAKNWVLG